MLPSWMNDQEFVQEKEKWFERCLVGKLNEISWRKSDRLQAAGDAMTEYGWNGQGFAATLRAYELEANTEAHQSVGRRKHGL